MNNGGRGSDIFVAYAAAGATNFVARYSRNNRFRYDWINSTTGNRTGHIRDYWATEHDLPKKDTSQDVTLTGFDFSSNLHTYQFVRPLKTGDANDVDIISTSRTCTPRHFNFSSVDSVSYSALRLDLIWSTNQDRRPIDIDGLMFPKHRLRGAIPILWNHKSKCSSSPPSEGVGANDTKSWTNGQGTWRVRWEIDYDSDEIEIEMSAKTTGWVAIGMTDTPHMPNSDVVVGWMETSGEKRIIDGWAGAVRVMPRPDTEVGGDDDVRLISMEQAKDNSSNTWTIVKWRRKLFTPDVHDMDIENRDIYVLWAYGSQPGTGSSFGVHYDRGIVQMNMAANTMNESVRADGRSRHTRGRTSHGIMMLVAWAGLITPGNFVARYIKPLTTRWFPIHIGLQISGIVLATVAWIIMSSDLGFQNDHFFSLHGIVGLLLMLASCTNPNFPMMCVLTTDFQIFKLFSDSCPIFSSMRTAARHRGCPTSSTGTWGAHCKSSLPQTSSWECGATGSYSTTLATTRIWN